jgi:antitoxin component of MazEF toxin-antitoxin module
MPLPLFILRVRRWGDSYGVTLPLMLRRELGVGAGDVLALRVHKPYATFCVWRAADAIALGQTDVATLPPLNPKELTRD